MRIGEITGLTWEDVIIEEESINDDKNNQQQHTGLTDSDMALLELFKSLSPEIESQK